MGARPWKKKSERVRVIRHTNGVIYAWRGTYGHNKETIYYDNCIGHMSMHDFPDNRPYYDLCAVLDVMEPTDAHNGTRFYHMSYREWEVICYECQRDKVHDDDG